MGSSAEAILCFGFVIKDEDGVAQEGPPDWLGDDIDFDDFVAKIKGLEEPTENYKRESKAWMEYHKQRQNIVEELGVELVMYGYLDDCSHILAVAESMKQGGWEVLELGQEIKVLPEWRDKLKEFCKLAGIEFQEPQFILCSYYG